MLLAGLGTSKKHNDLIGIQTHYLPACRILPQPTMLLHAIRVTAKLLECLPLPCCSAILISKAYNLLPTTYCFKICYPINEINVT